MRLTAKDYILHLRELYDRIPDDDPYRDDAKAVADFAQKIHDTFQGAKMSSVYFSLPLILQAVENTVRGYRQAAEDDGGIGEDEKEMISAIRKNMAVCIMDIDALLNPGIKQLTQEEIDQMLADLPPDKSDA